MEEGFDSGSFEGGSDVFDSVDTTLDVSADSIDVDFNMDLSANENIGPDLDTMDDFDSLVTEASNTDLEPIEDTFSDEPVLIDGIEDTSFEPELSESDSDQGLVHDDLLSKLQYEAESLEPLSLEEDVSVAFAENGSLESMPADMAADTVEYESNGYQYVADQEGRILNASGELRLEDGERNLKAQLDAGGEFRHEKDDGGHLIGTRFGGSGELDNLIAQDSNLNRSGFKTMENEWARELETGNNVAISIDPVYQDGTTRPHAIMGDYTVTDSGGEAQTEYFSFTNENLESSEFELPREADELMDAINN